jgi:glycosyltransferase involved in cell wall biosynthesis
MKKLLNVNSYHYRRGGSDVVYFEHAALMEQRGWENGYFSMHHPKNVPTPWSKYFIEELEFGNAYSTLDKVKMASKVIFSFEAQNKLKRLSNDFRADIAHLHCIYHHLSPSILYTLNDLGIPAVMTAHDLKIACPAYKMLNSEGICERCKTGSVLNVIKYKCVRDSLAASAIVAAESALHRTLQSYNRLLTRVIAPSRFFEHKLIEWGVPAQKITYIPNYVDASKFSPGFTPGEYFLYFGRLAVEKGVGTLIKAAKLARVHLKIAGTGPMEDELKAIAGDAENVEFLGFRSGDDLHNLIKNARAVVLPSEWYENAPMSILESFALGKPVIGAEIGGIPELITSGETGWTFPSSDLNALSDTLSRCASLPDTQLIQMGKSAREDVASRFTAQGYAEKMQAEYESILSKR